eukprot:CAMPEP_0195536138 /NCGR_PEP_ID=MMETSP0794_2-20130614/45522_1 /TAXON_ID=515487 /ORGANISM="Stephanopyxis turris, Strain CCMP 815" /LENGTH=295 /DNA_ID=CAMNT_0040669455 /DNA_START=18 /DNA_END=905 /DNA_ORIENTATION=+
MSPPTLWIRLRHSVGRALRETGQMVDRVGIRGAQHAISTRIVDDDAVIFDNPLSRHRNKMPLLRRGEPLIDGEDSSVFIAPCSTLIGSVRIGEGSSIWYGACLRADMCSNGMGKFKAKEQQLKWEKEEWYTMPEEESEKIDVIEKGSGGGAIVIGCGTNVQDGAVISANTNHCIIGDSVTIGHMAHIHSARVDSFSLIGMGSVLSPDSHVESYAFVAAGSVIKSGVTVPSGELWAGNPAKKLRDLTDTEKEKLVYQAEEYVKLGKNHCDVMTVGGNVPDYAIEHLMLEGEIENKP